jgi:hypothetical protein
MNQAYANVTIVINGKTVITNPDGFAVTTLPYGNYVALVTNNLGNAKSVPVVLDGIKTIDIQMNRTLALIWSFAATYDTIAPNDLLAIITQQNPVPMFNVDNEHAMIHDVTANLSEYTYIAFKGTRAQLLSITQNYSMPVVNAFSTMYTDTILLAGVPTVVTLLRTHDKGAFTSTLLSLLFS